MTTFDPDSVGIANGNFSVFRVLKKRRIRY